MPYTPGPEDRFSFGLWTVGNIGRDPFGDPVREARSPVQLVQLLAEVGAFMTMIWSRSMRRRRSATAS